MDDELQAKLEKRCSLHTKIKELEAKLDQEEKNYNTTKKTLEQDYNDRVNKIYTVLSPIVMDYNILDKDLRSRSSWGGHGYKK